MANRAGWFLRELKRRRVYHVAAAYAVVAFVVWQVADIVVPALELPDSAVTLVLVLTILGFPIALVLAWAYEVRPEGASPEETALPGAAHSASPADGTPGRAGAEASSPFEASVAVLPFANLGPSPEGDYFSDGMTEEITHVLARSPDLRVVARTSAFAFKEESADVRDVARRLGVSHLLEGSVRRAGERLRVTVQLIEAEGGMHVWSERYDRELDDVFALQDEIAGHVAERLAGALSGRPVYTRIFTGSAPVARTETSVEAYDAYLRGREQHARLDPRSYTVALERYREAIELDPDYAPAHAALAQVHTFQSIGLGIPSADTMPLALQAAERALALAPTLADAHLARAMVAMYYEWDFDRAKQGIDLAIELRPSYAEAFMWEELYWTYVRGRYEEAVAAARRAQELDLLEISVKVRLGSVYYVFGRNDVAVEYLEDLVAEDPESALAYMALGDARIRAGDPRGAVDAGVRSLELFGGVEGTPNGTLGVLAAIHGLAGDPDTARRFRDALAERGRQGSMTFFWEGIICAALGEMDEAFARFDEAVEKRDAGLLFLNAAPRALGLREDPRFHGVRERVGLPRVD